MKPKHPPQEEGVDGWLMSYADMITLLLCFFIIFVSTSEPRQERLVAATQGMKEKFGSLSLDSPYDGVYRDIIGIVAQNNADRNIAVEKTSRGMRVEISGIQFFLPGSAEIPESQLVVLKDIARALKAGTLVHYSIDIEGHTHDGAPPGAEYASNWELAAARAARIVRLLIEEGVDPTRLRATSYADTQPLLPNKDAAGNSIPGNREQNDRVIVRVEKRR